MRKLMCSLIFVLLAVSGSATVKATESKSAEALEITECEDARAKIEGIAGDAVDYDDESEIDSLAFECKWNCKKKCCTKIFGKIVCEPTCKSTCELRNASCGPITQCTFFHVTDPNYESLKDLWQTARDRGVFTDKRSCQDVAKKGNTAAGYICDSLNVTVIGGLACTAFNYVAKEENMCICDEIRY